jgi:HJR/Mrr/RecB family endonuclease
MSNNKGYHSVLRAMKGWEGNGIQLTEMLTPNKDLKEQIDRLLEPHYAIAQLAEERRKAEQNLKDMVSHTLPDIQNYQAPSLPVVDQAWADVLTYQSTFNLPDHIAEVILGFKIDPSILNLFSSDMTSGAFESLIQTFNYDHLFLGEYEINDFDDTESEPEAEFESPIILPAKLENSLKAVNFLPITLYEKVINDPELMRRVSPRDFEQFVAEIVDKLGFENVLVTPESGDGGRDIIATRTINDIPLVFAFECKRYAQSRKIGPSTMRSLLGTVTGSETKANVGVLVTTSSFTRGSKRIIAAETALDGKDFQDLVSWINQIKRA